MKFQFKDDALQRIIKTFLQAFFATLGVEIASVNFTGEKSEIKTALYAVAISCVSAGICACMNIEKIEEETDDDENE